jgi:hypothetical protein
MRYRLPVLDGINKETEELARKHCKYSQEAWVRGCVTGRISNLSGSGFLTNERAISLVSEARQSSRRLDTARSEGPHSRKYPKRALVATLPKKYRMFWPVLLDRADYKLMAESG